MAKLAAVKDVRKSYGQGTGRSEILRGVSLDIEKGDFLAMVGQSGSGKSTLLNILGGLDSADSGEVSVLGVNLVRAKDRELSNLRNRKIGFVFQSFQLLDHLSCLDNVLLPARFSMVSNSAAKWREIAHAKLESVGLRNLAEKRPSELSGGQKQRVAIARALLNEPELLLCDEPTGNLDSETGQQVIDLFGTLNQKSGVTLVIVTHEERVSTAAKSVVRIVDGMLQSQKEVV